MCELREVFDSGTVVVVDSAGIAGGRSSQGVVGQLVWKLEEAGDFQAGDAGDVAGEIFHLVREFFVDAA